MWSSSSTASNVSRERTPGSGGGSATPAGSTREAEWPRIVAGGMSMPQHIISIGVANGQHRIGIGGAAGPSRSQLQRAAVDDHHLLGNPSEQPSERIACLPRRNSGTNNGVADPTPTPIMRVLAWWASAPFSDVELVKQLLRGDKIGRGETLREAIVDRLKAGDGVGGAVLIAPQAGEACRNA